MIFLNHSANVVAHLTNFFHVSVGHFIFQKIKRRQRRCFKEWLKMSEVQPLDALYCFASCRSMVNKLMETTDAGVKLLALEGLFRIESDAHRHQFTDDVLEQVKSFLRKWRCESPRRVYTVMYGIPLHLRHLTIFKTLKVPLFIDDYGTKQLLSSYELMDVEINGDTPIFHVTHGEEAADIFEEEKFQPSDNKNIIEGTWFGLSNSSSVYGSYSFETTLSKLGVKGLHQGEVVSYKNEVNVILYAAVDTEFGCNQLKRPTDEAVMEGNDKAYVKISIFVPARFLPDNRARFRRVISGPTKVNHSPFCVREKRSNYECRELNRDA